MTDELDEFEDEVELTEPKKKSSRKSNPEIPEEIDWAKEFSGIKFDGKKLDEILKNHQIFTREDFLKAGVPKIASIIMAMYMADAQTMTVQVRQNLSKEA